MKKTALHLLLAALATQAFAEVVGNAAPVPGPSVPRFEKGDLVAFAGDSITSGGTYHKYIFTYWATRYPELGVRFRNKGIFSDFVHGGIGRLERDILKEKPNKVAINFGMNDSGASYRKDLFGMSDPDETVLQKRRETVATYRANMEKLLALLKERGIAPVLLGPSIYDNTMKSEAANNLGANSGIQACIEELKTLKNGIGFVDFNAPMLEVNARMQAKDPAFGIAGGDRVHPGPEGHWVIAYEFLKAQSASPIVASVKVDAAKGAVLENANCEVESLQAADGRGVGSGGTRRGSQYRNARSESRSAPREGRRCLHPGAGRAGGAHPPTPPNGMRNAG
jgi:lysophospholipase L1-like esterase